MRASYFIPLLLLVVAPGCGPRADINSGAQKFAARPRNYKFEKEAAKADRPERWWFADTPTFWETNNHEMIATLDGCLEAIGLPAVTNKGQRDGRISELDGGSIYYHWPDYQLGTLKVTFVEEYGMERGQLRVHSIVKPEQLTNQIQRTGR